MPETFLWSQTNGAGATVTDLGGDATQVWNFKSIDDAIASNFASNLIVGSDTANAGNSFEVYFRLKFGGTFGTIQNIKFWVDTGFLKPDLTPAPGFTLKFYKPGSYAAITYATPTRNDSTVATVVVPTTQPAANNIGIAGALAGVLSAPGYTDYQCLQLHAGTSAPPGATSLIIYKVIYDVA